MIKGFVTLRGDVMAWVNQQDWSDYPNLNVPGLVDEVFVYFDNNYVRGRPRPNGQRGRVR